MWTSSGIRSSSTSWRQKSKSGWLAAGKPTSISLKPIFTSSVNIFSLRAGSIGSIRAWLPSRRSTEHQRGALSITTFGQVRSVSTIGTNGWYFSKGIFSGVTLAGGMAWLQWGIEWRSCELARKSMKPPGRRLRGGRTRLCERSPYIRRSSSRNDNRRPPYPNEPAKLNRCGSIRGSTLGRCRAVDETVAERRARWQALIEAVRSRGFTAPGSSRRSCWRTSCEHDGPLVELGRLDRADARAGDP